MHRALLLIAALGLGGCVLHLSDDTACGDDIGPPPAGGDLVNPSSLQCERFAEPPCGEFDPSIPTWGSCESACFAHGEATCLNTPGCRGAYDHDCLFGTGPCAAMTAFLGCFPVDNNPDFATPCDGLDAWNCSRHEQCFATHRAAPGCRDGLDQDGDGQLDELDECPIGFARCLAEAVPF